MKKHINNAYNYVPKAGTVVEGVSLSVPGQALTVDEILQKHTRGLLPDGMERKGQYFLDSDSEDFDTAYDYAQVSRMDLAERYDLMSALQEDIRTHQRKLDDYKDKNKAAQQKKQAKLARLMELVEQQSIEPDEPGDAPTATAKGATRSKATTK